MTSSVQPQAREPRSHVPRERRSTAGTQGASSTPTDTSGRSLTTLGSPWPRAVTSPSPTSAPKPELAPLPSQQPAMCGSNECENVRSHGVRPRHESARLPYYRLCRGWVGLPADAKSMHSDRLLGRGGPPKRLLDHADAAPVIAAVDGDVVALAWLANDVRPALLAVGRRLLVDDGDWLRRSRLGRILLRAQRSKVKTAENRPLGSVS